LTQVKAQLYQFLLRNEVKEMEKIIRVTGKGTLSLPPDLINFHMTIESLEEDYDDALAKCNVAVKEIRDGIIPLSFDRSDLKTLSFNISPEYHSYTDDDGKWQSDFIGYKASQGLRLDFIIDNELLGKVIRVISDASIVPTFSIYYKSYYWGCGHQSNYRLTWKLWR
jgi:uncharacterized protein YggE